MTESQPPAAPFGEPGQWSAPPFQAPAPVEQPPSIRLAVRLMWVGAAFSALGIIVAFLQRGELRDQLRDSEESFTADELDTAVAAGLTFIGVLGVIGIALWLWMAATNGQGKTWARTVATVLGALNVVFTLLGFLGGQLTPLNVAVSLLMMALAITILVLLYRPESSSYYEYKTRLST